MEIINESSYFFLLLFLVPLLPAAYLLLPNAKRSLAPVLGGIASFTYVLLASVLLVQLRSDASIIMQGAWFSVENAFSFNWSVEFSYLSVVMLALVAVVAFMVQLFSIVYMRNDTHFPRFLSYIVFFTFFMSLLVASDQLFLLFMSWELVGWMSFLLIGFWFDKSKASIAAKKAFLINRVSDIFLVLGLMIIYYQFETFSIREIASLMSEQFFVDGMWLVEHSTHTNQLPVTWFTLASVMIVIAAMGKSAQIPFAIWLPDAMEGPTPASALIHAATMVVAGIYLLLRLSFMLSFEASLLAVAIGSITAFFAGYSAIYQTDIKKVLAYSTLSQLGLMFAAVGAGAYDSAFYHLYAHAFFKAALFLIAAATIAKAKQSFQAANKKQYDPQNMFHLGGMRKQSPFLAVAFIVSGLALCGFPLTSGFISKDLILLDLSAWSLESSEAGGGLIPLLLLGFIWGTVFLTPFYMMRAYWLTFEGTASVSSSLENKNDNRWGLQKLAVAFLVGMSLFYVLSWNPLGGTTHLEEGLSNYFSTAVWQDLSWQNSILAFKGAFAVYVGVFSVLLVIGALYLSYRRTKSEASAGMEHLLSKKLAFNFWGLNQALSLLFIVPGLVMIKLFHFIESKFLLPLARWVRSTASAGAKANQIPEEQLVVPLVDLLGIIMITFSLVVAWIDRVLVDGVTHFAARSVRTAGGMARSLQAGAVQTHILWAAFILLGVLLYVLVLVV
ncbi:MAG: NADH-quinone oxidoreductase subunit L [Cyclobacteriaceae bacterium]|nr:NADH-quinone oxidoreductase subunit L [Cyclobacteriaceae bacterium]MCH8515824.1 NADH-quinone oxidoreductase subunit L [Cyclobacteriaceae bacterium]